jgi:hypothetical protein
MSSDILNLDAAVSSSNSSSPPPPSSSSTVADRTGWLELYQAENFTFDRFYFILNSNQLQYSNDENQEPIGSIPLEGSSVEIINEDKYGKPFCFEFNAPLEGRTYVFHALTAPDLNDWLNSIRRAMLRIRRDKAKLAAQTRRAQNMNTNGSPSPASFNVERSPSSNSFEISQSNSTSSMETRDKYDVYRQWLEETKEQKKSRSSRSHRRDTSVSDGGVHQQLLEYGEEERPWYKKCCTIS